MRQVRTRHRAACDLSEGLALVCPRCRDAWYSPEPELEREPAPAVAVPAPACAPVAGRPDAGRHRAPGARPRRRRDTPPPAPRPATAARPPVLPQLAAPAPARPAVRPPVTVWVSGRGFWLQRPRGGITYRRGSALVVAPARRAPVSVRGSPAAARTVRAADERGSAAGPCSRGCGEPRCVGWPRVRLAGRPALRVTARRGATVRRSCARCACAASRFAEAVEGPRACATMAPPKQIRGAGGQAG
jgi:hypothetical protein